jgi:hypothetical protein
MAKKEARAKAASSSITTSPEFIAERRAENDRLWKAVEQRSAAWLAQTPLQRYLLSVSAVLSKPLELVQVAWELTLPAGYKRLDQSPDADVWLLACDKVEAQRALAAAEKRAANARTAKKRTNPRTGDELIPMPEGDDISLHDTIHRLRRVRGMSLRGIVNHLRAQYGFHIGRNRVASILRATKLASR